MQLFKKKIYSELWGIHLTNKPTNSCNNIISLSLTEVDSWVFAHFWATVCKTVRPVVSDGCPAVCPVWTLVYCGQTVGWINMKFIREVGLGPGHIVLDDPVPPPQRKGAHPQFSAHVYCGQMTGWIKMPLDTEVGLGPGHIVLDGDPAPPPKRGSAVLIFGPCLLWPNGRPYQLLLSTWTDNDDALLCMEPNRVQTFSN